VLQPSYEFKQLKVASLAAVLYSLLIKDMRLKYMSEFRVYYSKHLAGINTATFQQHLLLNYTLSMLHLKHAWRLSQSFSFKKIQDYNFRTN